MSPTTPTKSHPLLEEVIVVRHPVKQAAMTQAPSMRWVEVGDKLVVANAMGDLVALVVVVVVTVVAAMMMDSQPMENQSRSQGQGRELGDQLVEVELVCRT